MLVTLVRCIAAPKALEFRAPRLFSPGICAIVSGMGRCNRGRGVGETRELRDPPGVLVLSPAGYRDRRNPFLRRT